MVNSMYIAQDFINSLPRLETPEHTEGTQGFFHLTEINGKVEETSITRNSNAGSISTFPALAEIIISALCLR